MHNAGEGIAGVLVDGETVLLVLVFILLGQAALGDHEADGFLGAVHVGLEEFAVVAPAVDSGGEGQPLLEAGLGRFALDDAGGAVALGDGDGFLLENSDGGAEIKGADRGGNAGGASAADDDVNGDFSGKAGDGLKLNDGGVHVIGSDVLENKSGAGLDHGLDAAGVDSLAFGLRDAVLQRGLYGGTGDRGAADAVDLGALGGHDLLNQRVLGQLPDGRGLAGKVEVNVHDGIRVKGGGDDDGAHTVSRGGIGAGGIDPLFLGGGCRPEADPGHGNCSGSRERAFQKVSSADFGHTISPFLIYCYGGFPFFIIIKNAGFCQVLFRLGSGFFQE